MTPAVLLTLKTIPMGITQKEDFTNASGSSQGAQVTLEKFPTELNQFTETCLG